MDDITRLVRRTELPRLPDITLDDTGMHVDCRRVPTPATQVATAMDHLASAWQVSRRRCGWHNRFDAGTSTVTAYIGAHCEPVAEARHEELLVALRVLAWELEELCHAR
jgi:hypothetical protein